MPLTGFESLKTWFVRNKIVADSDGGGLGETVTWRFANGAECPIQCVPEFERNADIDQQGTVLAIAKISVVVMKSDLGDIIPKVGQEIVYQGVVYRCMEDVPEEGSTWWRILFTNEHLSYKGIKARGD